jgi:hypothetical protein
MKSLTRGVICVNGCRVVYGADGKLYFSMGDAPGITSGDAKAQDKNSLFTFRPMVAALCACAPSKLENVIGIVLCLGSLVLIARH